MKDAHPGAQYHASFDEAITTIPFFHFHIRSQMETHL